MLSDLFQTGPLPANQLIGVYSTALVVLSFTIAIFASYIALDLTGHLRDPNNTKSSRLLWLLGGAIAMGCGIWAMHFIGMLSFSIPGLTLQYSWYWTFISLAIAIFVSGFALFLLQVSIINLIHLISGGLVLGLGIASMHYTGMAAMLITLNFRYLPSLFFLSILIAIVASEAAIWLALKSNNTVVKFRSRIKLISAIIMGLAICGMHYTGMAASIFTPLCNVTLATNGQNSVDPNILAISIGVITVIILAIAFFASNYKEALNQQQFEKARQLGIAEISASVLHNVGNVLNSVNVSANRLAEQMRSSKLSDLEKLCSLLNAHQANLGEFINKDPRGVKVLEFVNSISEYQKNEQKQISNEIAELLKNLLVIKNIISYQQDFSKPTSLESIHSITDLLNESLLISGVNLNKEIQLKKNYTKIITLVDKTKFLQIIINILNNAKDALLISTKQEKILSIKTTLSNAKISIEIMDNGMGISPENLKKLFHYGFTTKQSGHGFGLHSSIIAMHQLGGEIFVNSEGSEKGCIFTLELPYKKIQ